MSTKAPLAADIDDETAQEVLYEFERHHAVVEEQIANSNDLEADDCLHLILCEIHSVRENAAMVQLFQVMSFTNAIENVVLSLMNDNISTSPEVGEVILMSMDRLRDLHHVHLSGANFDNLNTENIELALAELAVEYEPAAVDDALKKVLWELTHCFADDHPIIEGAVCSVNPHDDFTDAQQTDLAVFRNMAIQIDNLCTFWRNRSDTLCHWARAINNIAGNPLNNAQLFAAIYLHDTGMAFVSSSILMKTDKLDTYELSQLHQHTRWGYEVVVRMPGWEGAAQMIQQHHEREDGKGYPNQIEAHDICEGAKLIAILDAFFAMIKPRADRPRRRSILRAISEINACAGTQFSEAWVDCFNIAMKQDMKDGLLTQMITDDSV